MMSISEVAPTSKIVRAETFNWDAEMHSITQDIQLLGIFLGIFGLMKFRVHRVKVNSASPKKSATNHVPSKKSSETGLSPAQEIATLTGERQKDRVLQLYQQPQFPASLSTLTPDESYQVFFNICLAAGRSGKMDCLELALADMRKMCCFLNCETGSLKNYFEIIREDKLSAATNCLELSRKDLKGLQKFGKQRRKMNASRTEELYTMLMKIFAAKRLFKQVLGLAKWMRVDNVKITNSLGWSCLCFSATEEREWSAALYFFKKLDSCGDPNVKDYGNAMKAHSGLEDATGAFELIKLMRERSIEPDAVMFNMAFAACCLGGKHLDLAEELLRMVEGNLDIVDAITFNTLIKGYVQAGRIGDAFAMLKEMKTLGALPTVVTFGTLLDACINVGDMDKASAVFDMIQTSGYEMNNVLCTTLIKGFAKQGQIVQAVQVFQCMLEQGVKPDKVTYSTLVKAFCDKKDLEGALRLFEDLCGKGHSPDEVIFNTLLNGCANCINLELGERIFKDMVSQGIKPTVSSISTMLKLYAECRSLPQAVQLLQGMECQFGIAPEQRLYTQLVHAALRTRRHALAVEMFRAMQDFGTVPDVEIKKLIQLCTNFNMLQTAVAFAELLLEKVGLRAEHLQTIVDAAAKKKKDAFLRSALNLANKYELKIQIPNYQ